MREYFLLVCNYETVFKKNVSNNSIWEAQKMKMGWTKRNNDIDNLNTRRTIYKWLFTGENCRWLFNLIKTE